MIVFPVRVLTKICMVEYEDDGGRGKSQGASAEGFIRSRSQLMTQHHVLRHEERSAWPGPTPQNHHLASFHDHRPKT